MGALGGGALGGFTGQKFGHGLLGTIGGAIAGSKLEDTAKERRNQKHDPKYGGGGGYGRDDGMAYGGGGYAAGSHGGGKHRDRRGSDSSGSSGSDRGHGKKDKHHRKHHD